MKKESLIPAVVVGLAVLAVGRMSDAQGAAVNDAEKPRFVGCNGGTDQGTKRCGHEEDMARDAEMLR